MDDGTVGGGVINDGTRDALIEELQATFLFAPFSEEELYWLVAHAEVVSVAPGGHVFIERQPPDVLWVLLSGEWRLGRTVGARHVVVGMSSTPGVWAGWLPVIERLALEVQVTRPSRLLRIPHTAVEHMLMSGYPIACHLITGIYQGVQNIMMQTRQQEKMIALGKLSAGLAHRLNNPAAAARSAATDLRRVLSQGQAPPVFRATDGRPNDTAVAPTGGLQDLMREIATRTATVEPLDPLARTDREDSIAAWLDDHGILNSYDAAGTLVDAGLDVAWLEDVARKISPEAVSAVVCTITMTATATSLIDQIERSTTRISELVAAVKSYSHMDQAPMQEIDIHAGLESTLTMLGHELRSGITVVRDYDRSLPRIWAIGSDLNQVWTNLIDNAIDAMNGSGELLRRTRQDGAEVVVEIGDTGHGIPPEIQSRVFDPFFTSKGVEQGSGLGLGIAYRIIVAQHRGDITLRSSPAGTVFTVRLPVMGPNDRSRDMPIEEEGDKG